MKRVLLVEPDKVVGDMIAAYLHTNHGVQVDAAATAQDGVHAADEHTPDLVIVELGMSRHNGIAFLHEFRSQNDWVNIPVIIHSHISQDNLGLTRDEWQRLGVVKYLYKSTTSLARLSQVVSETLGL
jgi:DNA-binding response OmpR family regulator